MWHAVGNAEQRAAQTVEDKTSEFERIFKEIDADGSGGARPPLAIFGCLFPS